MVVLNSFFSSAFSARSLDKLFRLLPENQTTSALRSDAGRIGQKIDKEGGFERLDLRVSGVHADAISRIESSIAVIKSVLETRGVASERLSFLSGVTVTRSERHQQKRDEPFSSDYRLTVTGTPLADDFDILSTGPRKVGVSGGYGADLLAISAREVADVSGGHGNDTVRLNGERISAIASDDGADTIFMLGQQVSAIRGGAGSDTITISAQHVVGVEGDGSGNAAAAARPELAALNSPDNDAITITARRIGTVDAGQGNDRVLISGDEITGIRGGTGDDFVSLTGNDVQGVDGGDGNDVMMIGAAKAQGIRGGKGDDHITLLKAGDATVHFAKGDGRDMIALAGPTTIVLEDGLSSGKATISRDETAIRIAFSDSRDTITLLHAYADFDGEDGPSVTFLENGTIRIA